MKCCGTPMSAAAMQEADADSRPINARPRQGQKPREQKVRKSLKPSAFDPQADDGLRLTPSKRKLILLRDGSSSPKSRMKKAALDPEEAQESLLRGATRGDIKAIQKALESGASPSAPNSRGLTPLMQCAAAQGATATEASKLLVEHGASADAVDGNGWTALHHACRSGKSATATYLLGICTDPSAVTGDKYMRTPLMLAIEDDKREVVTHLLRDKKLQNQMNAKDAHGWTALHCAMKRGSKDIVKVLLDYRVKPRISNCEGQQPFMVACEQGKLDCAKLLFSGQAKIDVNAHDNENRTALMLACRRGNEDVAIWLVKKCKADTLAVDIHGESAVTISRRMGLQKALAAMTRSKDDGDGDGGEGVSKPKKSE